MMTKHRLLTGLFVVAALGTYPALAQTPAKPTPTKLGIARTGKSDITATAANSATNAGVTVLSGGVTLVIDGTRVLADEAEIASATGEVKLRGNVRIQFRER